ncbi:MAG: glycosyltransferase family 39 protein [Patescibacteria group bacterium]
MKSFSFFNKEKILLFVILILGAILRLYGLNWDEGHYLHPDERIYVNSSNIYIPKEFSLLLSKDSPLNSKEFSYGSFPLFIYKIIHAAILPNPSFLFVSRLVSSVFSVLTIPLIFFVSKELFNKKIGIIAALIFAFSTGSIQHAHFNTTESMLIFFITLITFLSIKAVKNKNYLLFVPLGLLIGMSYATKIVGLTFLIVPMISFVFLFFKEKKLKKLIFFILLFVFTSAIFGAVLAPYQIIDFARFKERQNYEQNVVYGRNKPVYTIIYEQTKPYLYPLMKILPFAFGFISVPLSFVGLALIFKKLKEKKSYMYLFILIFPILYFLWTGAWYAKFSRYYVLLIPFLSFWASVALVRFKKPTLLVLLFFIVVNGMLYLNIYIKPHTRIAASSWIYRNVSTQATIAGEHWDDSLPLMLSTNLGKQYQMIQLPVYEPDSLEKISSLSTTLSQSDYFVISSRRVYYSILKNPKQYPYTSNFYQLLFKEKLGFKLVKKFTNYPFYVSDDFADESFQSYDHPPVLIFKNVRKYSDAYIRNLLL